MFLAILPLILKWLPGGLLEPILNHLQKKADTETARMEIQVRQEIELRKAQRDVLVKESEHWIAWLPRFVIGMSVALYIGAIFLVSTFQLDWVVLKVPAEMDSVMAVVVGGLFLEKAVKIAKR